MTFKQKLVDPLDTIKGCQSCNTNAWDVQEDVDALVSAHIVCCNDSPRAVVLGTSEEAYKVCVRLKREWEEKQEQNNPGGRLSMAYWRIVESVAILEK